jgi:hypothetical protein
MLLITDNTQSIGIVGVSIDPERIRLSVLCTWEENYFMNLSQQAMQIVP